MALNIAREIGAKRNEGDQWTSRAFEMIQADNAQLRALTTSLQSQVSALQSAAATSTTTTTTAATVTPATTSGVQQVYGGTGITISGSQTTPRVNLSGVLYNQDALRLGHGIYISAAHTNATPEQIYTFLSYDGVAWTLFGNGPIFNDTDRDPAMLHYDSKWWLAATAGGGLNNTTYFNLYTSTDLQTWSAAQQVNTGVTAPTWAPKWYVDLDGSVHIYFGGGASTKSIYEMHPTDRTMSTWSTATEVLTGGADSYIDPCVVRVGDTYYMFFKDDTTGYICLATSSSLTSGWTVTQTGNWAGWAQASGTIEGPDIVQQDDGKWRLYFTNNSGLSALNIYYSETIDSTFATGWSTPTALSTFSGYNHPVPLRIIGGLDLWDRIREMMEQANGLATLGSGATLPDAQLPDTGVTAGSYTSTNLTVDAKGRLTAASSGSASSSDYVVASDGATPPSPLNDGAGNFIYVGYSP